MTLLLTRSTRLKKAAEEAHHFYTVNTHFETLLLLNESLQP